MAPPHAAPTTKPLVEHPAALAGEVNLALAAPSNAVRMGGAFSFMCTLRMDGIRSWSRVFDFSLTADEDSITAGAVGLTGDLHFTVFRGKKPFSARVSNFFELGEEATMLCTVSPSGHMKVFKDGVLVGENEEGAAPLRQDRPRMIVGGHYLYADQAFHGTLRDIKVWNQEVAWPKQEKAEVWQVDGGSPRDSDAVLAPGGYGKVVPIAVLVESPDAESLESGGEPESEPKPESRPELLDDAVSSSGTGKGANGPDLKISQAVLAS
jgi:hypothetical protein